MVDPYKLKIAKNR